MSTVVELFLEGFEVFDRPTRIPLRRLTFLFGPNSAGKSAVGHALQLLADVCSTSESDGTSIGDAAFRDTLRRVWRRHSERQGDRARELAIGLTVEGSTSELFMLEEVHDLDSSKVRWDAETHTLGIVLRYRDMDPLKSTFHVRQDLVLLIDGEPMLELNEHSSVGLHFGHPLLAAMPVPAVSDAVASFMPQRLTQADGWIRFHGAFRLNADKRLDLQTFEVGWIQEWEAGPETPPPEFMSGLHAFTDAFDKILHNGLNLLHDTVGWNRIVPASRRTPQARELIYLEGGGSDFVLIQEQLASDEDYRALARSFVRRERARIFRLPDENDSPEGFANRVNHVFTDYLFSRSGYMLVPEVHALLDEGQLRKRCSTEDDPSDLREVPVIVSLHLEDAHGRRYAFDEVGSGLGYVLPVLAGVCDREQKVVVVQQPELHLHPALQAQLGDALLEEAVGGRCLVIETHSEHLLLRVLRRVRTQYTIQSIGRYFEPEDVAVLYFDPELNGTTTVKRLRIGADGDFLDRWPNGFFADRDADLFDE